MIRVFGSDECLNCSLVISILDEISIKYEYIDAFSEDSKIEKICDEYDIDELPHVQFLDETGEVVDEIIGTEDFVSNLKNIVKNIK